MQEKTNGELDTAIQLVAQDTREIKDTVSRIEMQTIRTNGRVSSLEVWKGFITGGLAVIVLLLLPILFIMVTNYLK